MARQLIPDHAWEAVKPLLPERTRNPKGGRPNVRDRDVLTGILFVLKTGIAWDDLPLEMGCGCGVTCLRRLREWHQMGIWHRIAEVLQQSLTHSKRIDWARALADADMPRRRRRRNSGAVQNTSSPVLLQERWKRPYAPLALPPWPSRQVESCGYEAETGTPTGTEGGKT